MSIFLRSEYGNNKLSASDILKTPVLFLAFGFGSGLTKLIPGTMGTVAAIPVYLLFIQADFWLYSMLTVLVMISGIWICDSATKQLGVDDFGGIVWDEIAGFLITMWLVPFSWYAVFLGFVFFRVFDILKPWPIGWIDKKVKGGLGIMLDDVFAAVFAAAAVLLII
ncbi:MAG: phosphatidylglycerophosphatase A [Methylococcales symbiont of Iophon sp. n. MRB-2018]|nr:MAG: phosphatidylglycerophosphatase A [Methylococcales symbiont of Iophon sp. n. MRB-2018]KAF3979155.1 MAG: phosphatidylglycerophosphatase A [Methylococcales symbiont of Iophon sp. n. MRB-2018]